MTRTVLLANVATRLSMKLDSHQIAHLEPASQQPPAPTFQRFEYKRQAPAKMRAIERRQERNAKFSQVGRWN